MTYKLTLDIFEGPLDLLLFLIKKNDIDICDIPIREITDQYMEYIEMMKILDLDLVGDFLVMAATLLQIKSKMLLPPDPFQVEEEEDPRDELVRRLQEYKVFKEIAEQLKDKEIERQNLYPRAIDQDKYKELKSDATEYFFEASLFDLINALSAVLKRFKDETVYEVQRDEFTVEDKIHDILHLLLSKPKALLTDFFTNARSKSEVIVTFIAALELIRLKEIVIMQKRLFSDIYVMRNRENVVPNSLGE